MNCSAKRPPERPGRPRRPPSGRGPDAAGREEATAEGQNRRPGEGHARRGETPPGTGRRTADGLAAGARWLLAGLLLTLLCGCMARVITTPVESSYASPQAALAALEPFPAAAALSATARIRTQHQGQPVSLRIALLVRKPASLRLESLPLMGPPDFFLSIADGELRVFSPGDGGGRFYSGRATAENLSRFFPLALPPTAMVSLLLGEAEMGLQQGDSGPSLRGEQESTLYRVDQYRQDRKYRSLWIDPVRHRLVRFRLFGEQGEPLTTVTFADHLRGEAGYLPREIAVTHHALPGIEIRYGDMQRIAGAGVDFALPLPAGMVPLPLDGTIPAAP